MSIFDKLGHQTPAMPRGAAQMRPDQAMQQELGQIKSNPGSYLKSKGYNIPDGMTDARQITQYLLQTQQVGTPRLQKVASMFGWAPGRR